jgi:starch phosphorylase
VVEKIKKTTMTQFSKFTHPYKIDPKYKQTSAYFCMEFGINQALKIYSGGLGYLAGSHMRSAYELKQNLVGVGILWKYGYYDQIRGGDQSMDVLFQEKTYNFLEDTGIQFGIMVNKHEIRVKAWYLPPDVFGTAPLFFLSTDLPENDYLARTITHRLYDGNTETKIAQYVLLGIGGAKLLELIGHEPEVYHINEAHALPVAFHLYNKLGSVEEVKKKLVFTTHTPVPAGNEEHNIHLLDKMGFFDQVNLERVRQSTGVMSDNFNLTLGALRMSRLSNGVSKLHGKVAREMWGGYDNICPITHITNSQNKKYWSDKVMDEALAKGDDEALQARKREMKEELFEEVADQTGKILDPDKLTIVWARRFAAYKRADLITRDFEQFQRMMAHAKHPIQMIWAGKPYPTDYNAIGTFNHLVKISKEHSNCAVLVGYELELSRKLKRGSDIWLNTPRVTREASGTSGMTAAMNGSINFSTFDGWIPEFAKDKVNSFIIPPVDTSRPLEEQDAEDLKNLLLILKNTVLPLYYEDKEGWAKMMKASMNDVVPFFDSDRMAHDYYEKLYSEE